MSDETALRNYLAELEKAYQQGNATEHTYRPALKILLEALAPGVAATNEPKRAQYGAPDYVISRADGGISATIGYAEAKDIGVPLAKIEKDEQLTRYRRALPNLLLTDYLEFRWYVNGEPRATARLASVASDKHLPLDRASIEPLLLLLKSFLERNAELIRSPKDMAERMARLAHMIRDLTIASFTQGNPSSTLTDLHKAFKEVLLPDLSVPDFADMFAQTLAYGLFAARTNHHGLASTFSRRDAASEIPKTNPFLRKLFGAITGPDLDDEPFIGFVNDLTNLLALADMGEILRDFGKRTRQEDPMVHFFETFLTAYDPKVRELRGVYYTPEPVVSYLAHSVDALLVSEFGCPNGLADEQKIVREQTTEKIDEKTGKTIIEKKTVSLPKVLVLDPATGTGTFLYKIVELIRERFQTSGNAGMWSGYVREQILPRLFGFELLMPPYAMAHLKLGMQLAALDLPEEQRRRWAYNFEGNERLGIYLTNTLEEMAKRAEALQFANYISDEANAATSIKRDDPVMVVIGNPPYNANSTNKGDWIMGLLHGTDAMKNQPIRKTDSYFMVDGQPLGERNPKWLNDDYVKFIRFAQWRIERSGHGILAFITNHGYLDNPTFRGMRQSLMRSFDDLYLLDLHGNSKKKERTPEGGKDENVFDIQQGVAIGIFVKRQHTTVAAAPQQATVHHAHLWGERKSKYDWLASHHIADTPWQTLTPQRPFYLFKPRNTELELEYQQGWQVTEIMRVNSIGIVTARDALTIHWNAEDVWKTITDFSKLPIEQARDKYDLGPDARDWQVTLAQKDIKSSGPFHENIKPILYRPFDTRQTYYTGLSRGFQCMPRPEVMRHMLAGANIGLITNRQVNGSFRHTLCSRVIINDCTVSTETRERSYLFPLYLYPDLKNLDLWSDASPSDAPGGRRPNLAPAFVVELTQKLGLAWVSDGRGDLETTVGPEDVFHYLYALLSTPGYRERYAEFLKSDFPRVPLTSNVVLFRALCSLGAQLTQLHLMERHWSSAELPSYPQPGDDTVERINYTAPGEGIGADREHGRVWINSTQYFAGVAPEVWEFHIGGYQVCEKWLKDRKGRTLSYEDIQHYRQVVAALGETIRLMDDLDEVIEEHGGWPLR